MPKNIAFSLMYLAMVIFANGFNHPDMAGVYSFFAAVFATVGMVSYPFRVCGAMNT